jgi:RecG-like helicase
VLVDRIQTVRGTVVACDYIAMRGRPRFEATLDDGTGKLALTWFNGSWLRQRIHPGMMIRVRGKSVDDHLYDVHGVGWPGSGSEAEA